MKKIIPILALAIVLMPACSNANAYPDKERFDNVPDKAYAAEPVEQEPEPVIEPEPIVEPEPEPEPVVEEYYEEPVYYPEGYNGDFKSQGVVYDGGVKYTWYSQNVLPGNGLTELNNNGRTVNSEGLVVDGDGYVAVASSDHEKGTVIDTPCGKAKVYDTGCPSGVVDVYTNY